VGVAGPGEIACKYGELYFFGAVGESSLANGGEDDDDDGDDDERACVCSGDAAEGQTGAKSEVLEQVRADRLGVGAGDEVDKRRSGRQRYVPLKFGKHKGERVRDKR